MDVSTCEVGGCNNPATEATLDTIVEGRPVKSEKDGNWWATHYPEGPVHYRCNEHRRYRPNLKISDEYIQWLKEMAQND
jgi:hypothetical protein